MTEVSPVQPENLLEPIVITPSGMIRFFISVLSSQYKWWAYSNGLDEIEAWHHAAMLGIITFFRLVQPEKAALLMLVTPSGMLMEVRPLQPEKAEDSMLVTFLPKMTSFINVYPLNQFWTEGQLILIVLRPLQPEYLQIALYLWFASKTVEKWWGSFCNG